MYVFLFDIDGTLVDTGGAGREAMSAAVPVEFDLPRKKLTIDTAGRSDRGITTDLFRTYGIDDTPEHWQRFHDRYVSLLQEELPRCKGRLLPGVTDLLAQLAQRDDVALGLLTGNVARSAQVKLAYYGVGHYFSFGGYGDIHSERADIARAALHDAAASVSFEVVPSRVWVIGDTPHDVSCARAIGAHCAAVATGIYSIEQLVPTEPDLLLSDLTFAEELLARL